MPKKNPKKTDCVFCKKENINEGIIYEDKNFIIKVGFAIIAAGHVMIIPKKHYSCFGAMPVNLLKEYDKLKTKLIKEIETKFSRPILIEYGVWGQSINHAHMHFIPKSSAGYKIKNIISEIKRCHPGFKIKYKKIKKIEYLKKIYEKEKEYVLIERKKRIYIFSTKNIGEKRNSCLDYRILFTKKGIKGVKNWRKLTKKEKIADNYKRHLTKTVLDFDDF
ncbi:MAG: HIT domain-containing protein [Candidatus Magasanikbacteria bacterium]|nr:HIT domain-containing protein [Candidatus Magasanikbacteria bacterium]